MGVSICVYKNIFRYEKVVDKGKHFSEVCERILAFVIGVSVMYFSCNFFDDGRPLSIVNTVLSAIIN